MNEILSFIAGIMALGILFTMWMIFVLGLILLGILVFISFKEC